MRQLLRFVKGHLTLAVTMRLTPEKLRELSQETDDFETHEAADSESEASVLPLLEQYTHRIKVHVRFSPDLRSYEYHHNDSILKYTEKGVDSN